ncbi:MAG: SCP2 sterol-binding domain-containing protein [Acidimicrobiales bacterium]
MRLYSPEWVDAFTRAVADLTPEPGVSFRMRQVVEGGPDGTLQVTLEVGTGGSAGGIVLRVRPSGAPGAGDVGAPEPEPQVTVKVAYEDAVALARGELDPATLLREGRVKVRGDLSVLVAGQAILAEAAARLEGLSEETTF